MTIQIIVPRVVKSGNCQTYLTTVEPEIFEGSAFTDNCLTTNSKRNKFTVKTKV